MNELMTPPNRTSETALERPAPRPLGPVASSVPPLAADDASQLREWLRVLWTRRYIVLTAVIIVTTLAGVHVFNTPPSYEASAVVEILKEDNALAKPGDLDTSDRPDPNYEVDLKTKMLMLNSRELHENLLVSLNLDRNRRFLDDAANESAWSKMVRAVTTWRTPQASAPAGADIPQLKDVAPQRSAEESARLAPYVDALDRAFAVETVKGTRAVRVTFTHRDPAIAAAVANGAVKMLMDRNFEVKTSKFNATAYWLDGATRELKARVETAEQKLADYSGSHNILTIQKGESAETTLTTDRLAQLHDQAMHAESDRILKESLYNQLRAGSVSELPESAQDPQLVELRKQLADLQKDLAQKRVKFGPENPAVVQVQQQIDAVTGQITAGEARLAQTIRLDYERAKQTEGAFAADLERTKRDALAENQASIQYNILKQDLDTARTLYDDFLQKTNQARANVVEQQNNIRVLEAAQVPVLPSGPKRLLTILLALFLGAGLGVGAVALLHVVDSSLKTTDDMTRYLQIAPLGAIPSITASSTNTKLLDRVKVAVRRRKLDGFVNVDNTSAVAEAYRALRTSILLSCVDAPPRTLLVTSAQPSEGKSTTAMNVAMSLAHLGREVLLVDCDLRHPMSNAILGEKQAAGLATFLSGNGDLDSLIRPTATPNFSVLPAGPVPPNPAELLSSERMRATLAELASRYDHVVLDAPPVLSVTDPVILATLVDGVVLVFREGRTPRAQARRVKDELARVGARVIGAVLNDVAPEHDHYTYGYGNKYTNNAGPARLISARE